MGLLASLLDLLLHLDRHLGNLVDERRNWIYLILFAIVFAETGLVVTPFLPGDSLLFAAGAIAATGAMDGRLMALLMMVAAIAGNTVNYAVGRFAGARIIEKAGRDPRWGR